MSQKYTEDLFLRLEEIGVKVEPLLKRIEAVLDIVEEPLPIPGNEINEGPKPEPENEAEHPYLGQGPIIYDDTVERQDEKKCFDRKHTLAIADKGQLISINSRDELESFKEELKNYNGIISVVSNIENEMYQNLVNKFVTTVLNRLNFAYEEEDLTEKVVKKVMKYLFGDGADLKKLILGSLKTKKNQELLNEIKLYLEALGFIAIVAKDDASLDDDIYEDFTILGKGNRVGRTILPCYMLRYFDGTEIQVDKRDGRVDVE